ncbi:pentapeptide repeat-containing protein [Massilia scottii]|uniref:pentapeptide repeat-containing protein n=1 Tax=Massilia scottii TaxID=3057166 RepID=UPI002796C246|nr:pentapeptide repeat-containing protein [Massilia sp. CCM 9029]MDQ1833309.1 pentapeptide repeat-containing protein [Massilia sp. CCM 9029]
MLFEGERFEASLRKPAGWNDHVYRYCEFIGIDTEGGNVDSAFIGCTIERCTWYWGLFNCALFVNVKFTNCTFRGTSFGGCKFVECEFVDCHFVKDNLNGACSFEDIAWYKCTQTRCPGLEAEFLSRPPASRRPVAKYAKGRA